VICAGLLATCWDISWIVLLLGNIGLSKLVWVGLFLLCKDVTKFVDKAVEEALKRQEREGMSMEK